MDVKKIGRIPDGGGWRAHGRAAGHQPRPQQAGSATTTSTPWSMTTPGWPTAEVLPDEKGATCAGVPGPRRRLLRRPRHRPHRAGHHRQRLGLPLVTARGRAPSSAPSRCSSSRTAPGRTARSNASTAPCRPSGPTGRSSPATPNAPPPLPPGSSTTTLDDATAPSEAPHRSADCHQPDGRVHLIWSEHAVKRACVIGSRPAAPAAP